MVVSQWGMVRGQESKSRESNTEMPVAHLEPKVHRMCVGSQDILSTEETSATHGERNLRECLFLI